MSPREKHIPDDAQRTSVSLTAEDKFAIRWISEARRLKKNRRTTLNDVLVDALWYFLEKTEGKTREQIRTMIPIIIPEDEEPRSKIREMPKPKNKR